MSQTEQSPVFTDQQVRDLFRKARLVGEELWRRQVPTDCRVQWDRYMMPTVSGERFVVLDAWNMHGCEASGIKSMALCRADGIIYIQSADEMQPDKAGMPVLGFGCRLNSIHVRTFAYVDEIAERIEALEARLL